jgi:UV DNA damage endonuclease
MKIGYPCSNLRIGCSASRTFRLASYSPARLTETVNASLDCLEAILAWNADNRIQFFRISSDTIPFASHPVMDVDWRAEFGPRFARIGEFVRAHDMRINCHPGQYILLNAPREEIVERSIAELTYTAALFDMMELDHTHKMQIHTGGVYGDKPAAIERFIARYTKLPETIWRRLVIENDERQYTLADNLIIHEATGIPLLFDVFHHALNNQGESVPEALDLFMPTWDGHGTPSMDYSSQNPEKQAGAHTTSIVLDDWAAFFAQLGDREVDIMLEIKDKENSVLAVQEWLAANPQPAADPAPGRSA